MKKKVCIIDYGVNNILSVIKFLNKLGVDFENIQSSDSILNYSHIILPGVGSFKEGSQRLEKKGFKEAIRNAVLKKERKIIGICLGMQLLFESSEEFHQTSKGLELLNGRCLKLKEYKKANIIVPHIGWNEILVKKKGGLLKDIKDKSIFYFVHSYHAVPRDKSIITGTCLHGIEFAATIEHKNIFGCQFHPEKSYNLGFDILSNFLNN